jgi:hypothetical protein
MFPRRCILAAPPSTACFLQARKQNTQSAYGSKCIFSPAAFLLQNEMARLDNSSVLGGTELTLPHRLVTGLCAAMFKRISELTVQKETESLRMQPWACE